MKTHYELLGLTPQASIRAIEQSFLRLAKKCDPKHPLNGDSSTALAEYKLLHEAYRTLSDANARRLYDLTLRPPTLSERIRMARGATLTK